MKNNIKFILSSCGLYSSWCFVDSFNIMFDCGEGVSLQLKNRVYAIETIFISHSHQDHVLGLLSFIGIRNSARGDKQKPLNIVYPESYGMRDLRKFVETMYPRLTFKINWIQLDMRRNDVFPLKNNNQFVKFFPVEHSYNSVGYKIVEKRTKLKERYRGQNIPALKAKGITDDELHTVYLKNLFVYTLDSFSFDFSLHLQDTDVWIADSTFLKRKDRTDNTHMCYQDVVNVTQMYDVGVTFATHISPRYSISDIRLTPAYENVILVNNRKPIFIK